MMEIAAAISLASSAFNALKKGMETGREIEDMAGYFGKWFDAKDQITEVNQYSQNTPIVKKLFAGESVEAQALEITAAKHKVERMEKELREYLIYTGQGHFYEDMMRERRNIRNQRMREAKRKAEQKKLFLDITIIGGVAIIAIIVLVGTLTAIIR
jgi:hypothetical protein